MDKKIERATKVTRVKQGVFASLLIGLLILGIGYYQSSSAVRSQYVDPTHLNMEVVTQGKFVDALKLRGQVVPKTAIYLDTSAGGQVEQRLVEQGVYVAKGQPLVRLSNTNLQLDVMSREAQVTEQLNFLRNTQMNMQTSQLNLRRELLEVERQIKRLQRQYQQALPLAKKRVIAEEELAVLADDLAYYQGRKELTLERQQQEASIRSVQVAQLEDSAEMLQSNLQFARNNLKKLIITAPVSGYLSELNAEVGESKAQGARLGQIDIPNHYKLLINLDEYYLNQVELGMSVEVELGKQTVIAKVTKIDSRVRQSQFQIEVDLPTGLDHVKRGQGVDLALMMGGDDADALLLKRGAFVTSSGGHWVYVVSPRGDRAERRAIQLGKKNQDYYQVLSGLTAGEKVIISNYSQFDQAELLHL